MSSVERPRMTFDEWSAEGVRRFGADQKLWAFVCPSCGHVATVADWRAAGAADGEIGFSCVGRHLPNARKAFGEKGDGPCNYAGGGLFAINPLTVVDEKGAEHRLFAFAEVPT